MNDKIEKFLLAIVIFMTIFIIGGTLNLVVKKSNDCMMPVHSNYLYEEDNNHFSFQDFEEVNYPYLSDIIIFKVKTKRYFLSIGDIMMLFGLAGIIINSFLYLRIKNMKTKENNKNAD